MTMEFVHGLDIQLYEINQILKIAYLKNYLEDSYNPFFYKCNTFKYISKEKKFEFYISDLDKHINLEINKFIECYTIYIKK